MPQEIERKFLPRNDAWREHITSSQTITQGYLNVNPDSTVRVRLLVDGDNETGWLTIKGRTKGIARNEFEYLVPADEAREMLKMAGRHVISKTRHIIPHEGFTIEVDEFHDLNAGLVVIEIELPSEDAPYPDLPWMGEEVSHDIRYFNSKLLEHPYTEWNRTAWPYKEPVKDEYSR